MNAIPADSEWIDKFELKYLTGTSRNTIANHLDSMSLALKAIEAMSGDPEQYKTPAVDFFEHMVGFLTSPLFKGWKHVPSMVEAAAENVVEMFKEVERAALSIKAIYEYSVDSLGKYYLLLDTDDQVWVRTLSKRKHPVFMKLEEFLKTGAYPGITKLLEALVEKGKEINLVDYGMETIAIGTDESESVVTAINVSWSPKIVPIQVLSYVTPTYQHFGNSEYIISVNIQTGSADFIRKLRVMSQKMNAMQLAQQHTYYDQKYFIESSASILRGDFFKFLGIKHVLPGNFRFSTVEGKPGITNISIDFVQADIPLRKYEALVTQAYFDNRFLNEIIHYIMRNSGKYIPYYRKILTARNNNDFMQLKKWKRGTEPLIPGYPRWSKFLYYMVKPLPKNVFSQFTEYAPPTYEFLTGSFDAELTANAFEKVYKAVPTTVFTAIVSGFGSGFSPGIPTVPSLLNNQIQATFIKLEAEVASIMVDVFKSSTALYLKALLTDALKWEKLPKELEFDETLLGQIRNAMEKLNVTASCYPDLELPDLYTQGEYTPPDFYFFQDNVFKTSVFQSAVDASLKTTNIINQLARLNLVNKLGEATQTVNAFDKELKKVDILEQKIIAGQLESLNDEIGAQELYKTGLQMLDQTKQIVELETAVAKSKLSSIQQDLAEPGADSETTITRTIKSTGAKGEILKNQKMYLESQLDYYDTTTKLFDFINPPKNPTQFQARKQLLKSWGVVTPYGASVTEKILTDAISIEKDKTLRLARAFPTFKLYFIEKDKAEWVMFDDFYSFAAVKSIKVSKNRKSPVHTAVITLSNITNTLTDVSSVMSETAGLNQTAQEQDVDRIMLRVGCEIMIRMGFSNDPSKLPIVFQGAIASIQPGSELTFIAQGWGAELTNPIKDKHFGALSTVKHFGDLATAILNMSPGLRHFGSTYNLVEMIDDLSSVEFKGDIRKTWLARMKNLAVGLYGINPLLDHRDDNVWLVYNTAPTIWKEIIGGKGLGFDWVIQNKTAWEALNDILYYNPNYIIKILPYNEEDLQNLRSTLYIGPRDGYYQATDDHDPPSELFQNASQQYQTSRATWYLKTMNIEAKSVAELKALLLSEAGLDANTSPGGIVFNATFKQNSN